MAYRILFTGEILPDSSREETLATLKKISGLDADKAEKHFFRGEDVQLKICDSLEQAEALLEKLTNLQLPYKLHISTENNAGKRVYELKSQEHLRGTQWSV